MWRRIVLATFLAVTLGSLARSESVYSLIQRGRLDEARDSLSQHTSAGVRDGNVLFFQGLLETNGDEAARLMEAARTAPVKSIYLEDITYRLAQYYFVCGNYTRLGELANGYLSTWAKGTYRSQMIRLSVLSAEKTKAYDAALKQCDRYLSDNSGLDAQQWGLIDKARILEGNGKQIGAAETVRQLSRSRKGPGVPQALYLLGMQAVSKAHADDAIFYYNMLREAYPSAVGLDQLTAGLGNIPDRPSVDSRADRVTNTYYSVKVGVFSEMENARRQADKFKSLEQKVDIESKRISGKDYRVVYVGHFRNYNDAVAFKVKLEASQHETFQVVAR